MVERSLQQGWTLGGLRSLLDEEGISLRSVEPVRDWAEGGEAQDGIPLDRLMEMAGGLGASVVLASTAEGGTPDELAALASRAAGDGIGVTVEFLGWGPTTSLTAAWKLVRGTDAGLVYDTWHQRRGSGRDEDIDLVPAGLITDIQVADGPAMPGPDPVLEARFDRRLPGEGDMDVAEQLRRLARHGVEAPIGVEVWTEGNQLDPVAAARRAMDALRGVIGGPGPTH
jgi:sugar phosphate isomerase/epimerase